MIWRWTNIWFTNIPTTHDDFGKYVFYRFICDSRWHNLLPLSITPFMVFNRINCNFVKWQIFHECSAQLDARDDDVLRIDVKHIIDKIHHGPSAESLARVRIPKIAIICQHRVHLCICQWFLCWHFSCHRGLEPVVNCVISFFNRKLLPFAFTCFE